MKKTVLFIVLVLFWTVIIFPTNVLWENLTKELNKQNISLQAKEVDVKLFFLYNQIKIKDLTALESFNIKSLDIKQTIIDPLHVKIKGSSEYGDFIGEIAILDKKGFILFEKGSLKKAMFKSYFKKSEEGMKYEFKY